MLAYGLYDCLPRPFCRPTTLLCFVTLLPHSRTVKITRTEKGWNYRVLFGFFFLCFPLTQFTFQLPAFPALHTRCLLAHVMPLPPPQPPLRYQRISELRHVASRNFNTQLAQQLGGPSLTSYLHSLPQVYYPASSVRYMGHTSEIWQPCHKKFGNSLWGCS